MALLTILLVNIEALLWLMVQDLHEILGLDFFRLVEENTEGGHIYEQFFQR
jgi:hypothetical protein